MDGMTSSRLNGRHAGLRRRDAVRLRRRTEGSEAPVAGVYRGQASVARLQTIAYRSLRAKQLHLTPLQ